MHDHRARRGATLDLVNARDGAWVERVGAEPVNGLGGERHQPAGADQRGGLLEMGMDHSESSSFESPKVLPVFFHTR